MAMAGFPLPIRASISTSPSTVKWRTPQLPLPHSPGLASLDTERADRAVDFRAKSRGNEVFREFQALALFKFPSPSSRLGGKFDFGDHFVLSDNFGLGASEMFR